MKKVSAIVLALALSLSLFSVFASAAGPAIRVTVADDKGELVLIREEIELTDADEDGALTVNDGMILFHNAKFEGGAAAGYATGEGQYGPMITKLWGVENGGGYGYYVNDEMAYGLSDPLKDGDELYAFIYTDLTTWSDAYSFFDVKEAAVLTGEKLELTLSFAGFDEGGSPAVFPVDEGAITVDGKETGSKTDFTGKAEISFDEPGTYVVSATSESKKLVPAVCVVTVEADPNAATDPEPTEDPSVIEPAPSSSATEKTDEDGSGTVWLIVGVAAGAVLIAGVIFVLIKQKKENE